MQIETPHLQLTPSIPIHCLRESFSILLWVYQIMALEGILALSTVIRLVGVYIAYHIVRALYNISPFHPLSHIPGPKLAAATWFYEGWFDLILGGMYTNEIQRMHEVYGTKSANLVRCTVLVPAFGKTKTKTEYHIPRSCCAH
jgi:hypothetical protein